MGSIPSTPTEVFKKLSLLPLILILIVVLYVGATFKPAQKKEVTIVSSPSPIPSPIQTQINASKEQEGNVTLTVTPNSGKVGSTVLVSFAGLPKDTPRVSYLFKDSAGNSIPGGTINTSQISQTGSHSFTYTIPKTASLGKGYLGLTYFQLIDVTILAPLEVEK